MIMKPRNSNYYAFDGGQAGDALFPSLSATHPPRAFSSRSLLYKVGAIVDDHRITAA